MPPPPSVSCSPQSRHPAARRRRRGFLQGPQRLDHHRLQRRRRLRHLWAAAWRAIWASISRAGPTWCRRTCRAPAASRRPTTSTGWRPRTAPPSPPSAAPYRSRRCSRSRAPRSTATKFTWLGSISRDTSLCVTSAKSAIKTWDDFLAKPSTLGGEGAGADPDVFAHLYKNVFGAKAKLVTGYPGTNDIALAMERQEVDGFCGLSWSTLKSVHPDWLNNKSINIIVQAGLNKEPQLPQRSARHRRSPRTRSSCKSSSWWW